MTIARPEVVVGDEGEVLAIRASAAGVGAGVTAEREVGGGGEHQQWSGDFATHDPMDFKRYDSINEV